MGQSERVQNLLAGASGLPPEGRAVYLDAGCRGDAALRAEVESLLRAHDEAGRFLTMPTGAAPAPRDVVTATASLREGPGTRIGQYKLLQLIGEGGFGSVFMAEQEKPVSRKVALKIIKLGMDTRQVIARFEAERQALALMDHPNIARVLDAGATDTGRPYFAMELCKGDPIVEYCDKNNLSIPDRLGLFEQVCLAVQHAHTKGIIHRDLKPSNILVSTQDGRPHAKVIDFGIAKATASRLTEKTLFTEHRALIGTPEYMSPEQAEGSLDIDTRTDVYSLGVLLYELLTGTTPFNSRELRSAAYAEIQRIIREVEPPKPSTRLSHNTETLASVAARRHVEPRKLGTIVRGELDWIVMKAMEKDQQRRYETANGLAMDIRRYLTGEAVLAAPPSSAYRFKKFVRRNRAQVAAAALVTLALLLGLAGTAWQARVASSRAEAATKAETEASIARDAEKARADELEQVSDFQAKMLSQVNPTTAGLRLTEDVNRRFAAALEKAKVPEGERRDRAAAFRSQWALVNATDAATALIDETILKPAVKAIDEQFKEQPIVDAQMRQSLASLYHDLGQFSAAYPLQKRALETRRRELGEDHSDTLSSISAMGVLLQAQGRDAEAEPYVRESLDKSRRTLGEESEGTILAVNNMGSWLRAQGKFAEAEPYAREALDKSRRVLGEKSAATLTFINNYGALLEGMGRLADAESYLREALEKRRRELGDESSDTIDSLNNLSNLLQSQGRFAEAEPYAREALEKSRRVLGEEHPTTLTFVNNLGMLLNQQGKLAEAEPYVREALDKTRRALGEEHPNTLGGMANLGDTLLLEGKYAEAEPYIREALEKRRRILGEEHPDTIGSINVFGNLCREQGKFAEAEVYYREALEKERRVRGEDHPDTIIVMNNVGSMLLAQGRLAEAEPLIRESMERSRRVLGDENADTLLTINNMAVLLRLQGRFAEAEPYVRTIVSLSRRVLGEEHPGTITAIGNMGTMLLEEGKYAEAEPFLREAWEKTRRTTGEESAETIFWVHKMGAWHLAQGQLAEAEPYLTKAADVSRQQMGLAHPYTLHFIWSLGELRRRQGRYQDAMDLITLAEPAAREVLIEANTRRLATMLTTLGRARVGLGYDAERFALAEANLLEAYPTLVKSRGEAHGETLDCVRGLIDLYTAWNQAQPGKGYDTKAAEWNAKLDAAPSTPTQK